MLQRKIFAGVEVGKVMLDDIGLGNAIANIIYIMVFAAGIVGVWFFVNRKNKTGVIFWTSFTLNFFSYLYLMGNYIFYPKYLYPVVNKYWPLLNATLFILLIINFIKNKNAKTKGDTN